MHLNSQCRYPDLSNLFVREDVTALVEAALIGVPDELAAQRRMLEGPLPDVAIGEHCTTPYDCPFIERCWPKLPDHHVSKLYRIERKRALELEADGYATIYDLPSDLELSVIHARQVRSEEHTSELQSRLHLVCRLLLEKKKKIINNNKRDYE